LFAVRCSLCAVVGARLAFGDDFVEIKNEVGEEGPGGEFGGVEGRVGFGFAVGDGLLGCFGLGFEVGEVFGEGLFEDGEFGGIGVAAGGGAEEGGEAIRSGWGGGEDALGEGA